MRTRGPFALTLILALAVVLPASAEAGCDGANLTPAELTAKRASAAVRCSINRVRREYGLPKVKANKRLDKAARRHSNAMNRGNFFSHLSPKGADLVDRIARTGYLSGRGAWGVAENLRWGTGAEGTPRMAVESWMESAAHRSTMLSGRYRHVGVGVALGSPLGYAENDSAIYTADFGYH